MDEDEDEIVCCEFCGRELDSNEETVKGSCLDCILDGNYVDASPEVLAEAQAIDESLRAPYRRLEDR